MRLFLTFVSCLFAFSSFAQEKDSIFIAQYVKNSFTRYGVRGALVTVMDSTGHVIDTLRTQPGAGGQDAQMWIFAVPRRPTVFRVRVEHPDYEIREMTLEMKHPARLNEYRFPDMLLKIRKAESSEVRLGEAVVRATRVKMCYKGDTIEVDARAFKLSEGSMLDALVRNVPGCELRDNGEIYMNGRKVDYLTLNGKEFFKGNNRVMLDNLPYYTVDKLQFYNQQSERSQFMGKDVEKPDYVMNVKMKREYSTGFMGNIEAAAGTHERWLGRAFGLRFTDNSRLTLFANANNVNESRKPGAEGNWGTTDPSTGENKLQSAGGELMIDDKLGRYREQMNAQTGWTKSRGEERTASETFLSDASVFDRMQQSSTLHNFRFQLDNDLKLKRLGLTSGTHFTYNKDDGNTWQRTGRFSADPAELGSAVALLDSLFSAEVGSPWLRSLVNRTKTTSDTWARRWEGKQNLSYHKELPWGDDIVLQASGQWSDAKTRTSSLYHQDILSDGVVGNAVLQHRYLPGYDREQRYDAGASYSIHFLNHWHLTLSDTWRWRHHESQSNLYRLDWDSSYIATGVLPSVADYARLRDQSNSWHSLNRYRANEVSLMLHSHKYDSHRERYASFTLTLPALYTMTHEVYCRGFLDTRTSDYRWLFSPSVHWEYNTRHWRDTWLLDYEMDMHAVDLTQKVAFTDTSDPLRIEEGNPDLKPSQSHHFSFSFSSRLNAHHQQFLMWKTDVFILRHLVAQSIAYDTRTGAYTFRPVNVNGNWNSENSLSYRRTLDSAGRLMLDEQTRFDYYCHVDMKMTTSGAMNPRSKVHQYVTAQRLKLEYKRTKWQLALVGQVTWDRLHSPSATRLSSIDSQYGFTSQLSILNCQLSTDLMVYMRRGYNDASMNTTDCVLNAQLSHAFGAHKQWIVKAIGFDLLQQISTIRRTVNTQGRTETWYNTIPSYAMLSLICRLDIQPKKGKNK